MDREIMDAENIMDGMDAIRNIPNKSFVKWPLCILVRNETN